MKNNFPFFQNNPHLIYLDSAATTQKPQEVIQSLLNTYSQTNSNVHRSAYPLSQKITQQYEEVRNIISTYFTVPKTHSVVFTNGCTHGLNLLAHSIEPLIKGSVILLSELEHHANIVPWQQLAKKHNLTIKYIPYTEEYMLDMKKIDELLTEDVAIISVTQLSNVLGTVVDVKSICDMAKKVQALTIIDGAQGAAHLDTSISDIGCDFYVASSHKLYGPTGSGFLIGKTSLLEQMNPFLTGGNMIKKVSHKDSTWNEIPFKFEAGTLAIAEIIGMGEAISYLAKHKQNIFAQEKEVTAYAIEKLKEIAAVYTPTIQESIISFTLTESTHDVITLLGEKNICIRGGHHCCMPLMKALGVNSTIRISIGAYTTKEDIDVFVNELRKIKQLLGD